MAAAQLGVPIGRELELALLDDVDALLGLEPAARPPSGRFSSSATRLRASTSFASALSARSFSAASSDRRRRRARRRRGTGPDAARAPARAPAPRRRAARALELRRAPSRAPPRAPRARAPGAPPRRAPRRAAPRACRAPRAAPARRRRASPPPAARTPSSSLRSRLGAQLRRPRRGAALPRLRAPAPPSAPPPRPPRAALARRRARRARPARSRAERKKPTAARTPTRARKAKRPVMEEAPVEDPASTTDLRRLGKAADGGAAAAAPSGAGRNDPAARRGGRARIPLPDAPRRHHGSSSPSRWRSPPSARWPPSRWCGSTTLRRDLRLLSPGYLPLTRIAAQLDVKDWVAARALEARALDRAARAGVPPGRARATSPRSCGRRSRRGTRGRARARARAARGDDARFLDDVPTRLDALAARWSEYDRAGARAVRRARGGRGPGPAHAPRRSSRASSRSGSSRRGSRWT